MRWMVGGALIGVLLLSGCAGERVDAGAPSGAQATTSATPTGRPSLTPSPTPSATAAPRPTATSGVPATGEPALTASPAPTPVGDESTAPPAPATPLDDAVGACTSWQASLSQDAATYPATQSAAAAAAARAAAADTAWQPLASDMAGLVALGSDTSAEAVQQGQQLFTDLSTRCSDIGVTVSGG